MGLFAHHIAVEILGHEYSPETPMEHVVVFGVTLLFVVLTGYGTYAMIRDLRDWLRRERAAGE